MIGVGWEKRDGEKGGAATGGHERGGAAATDLLCALEARKNLLKLRRANGAILVPVKFAYALARKIRPICAGGVYAGDQG